MIRRRRKGRADTTRPPNREASNLSVRLKTGAGILAVLLLTALAGAAGVVRPLDYAMASARFDMLRRPASQTLTVVEIDAASIRSAGQWPWGRERFARVIENLQAAGAKSIAFDVDFSARSSPEADLALRRAIERRPGAVVLPTFVQPQGRGADRRVMETSPLGGISEQAVLASVNVPVDADGQVRRYRYGFGEGERYRASIGALLGGAAHGRTGEFLIDYGIRPVTVPHLSFEDVRADRFDPVLVRGRNILIGSTALELGDEFATPKARALPGVYVHALAYEGLRAGRDLRQLSDAVVLAFAAWAAYLLRPRKTRDLRKMLRRHLAVAAAAVAGPVILQAFAAVMADTGSVLFTQLVCLIWVVRDELARRAREVIEARETHLVQLAEHMRASRDKIHAAHDELQAVNAALDKALKARSDFLAMTSHEIRTPLNGIMGMTQVILADRSIDDALRDKVSLVHASGETMLALVDDILDVAKMESGNLTISPAQMDLHKLLAETAQLWADKAQAKGLSLRLDQADVPSMITEDSGRLRQILFNLASNAIKFTDSGEILLAARVEAGDDGETLVLQVSDSGIGIPPDKLGQIFEAFSQVDAGITRKYGGTGLGLAISRRLARAMGGDLTVESAPGSGSTFTVRVPLRRARTQPGIPGAEASNAAESLAAASVLLVEANPLAQGILKAALGGEVAAIQIAASHDEASSALSTRRYDIVLVEGRVLSGAGTDAPQSLAGLAQAAAGAQVILLWAGAAEDLPALQAAGAHRILLKPIDTAGLLRELQALYQAQAQAQTLEPGTFDAIGIVWAAE